MAQLSLPAAALQCGVRGRVRDRWIGWDFRSQYGRLNLIANNSCFLILPGWHRPNIGSRVLSLTERRVAADWRTRFGHPLFLLETFVDPQRFHGGVYRAANWMELGLTQASHCLFENAYAARLGLDLTNGVLTRFQTANSIFDAYGHEVEIDVLGIVTHSLVYFFAEPSIRKNVLGRGGWLDRVRLGLVDHDRELYLAEYDHE